MQLTDGLQRAMSRTRRRWLDQAATAFGRSSYVTERGRLPERCLSAWILSGARFSGRRPEWRSQVRDAVLDWVASRCTFEEGRARVERALLQSRAEQVPSGELLGLRHLVGSVGFFSLTDQLLQRAIEGELDRFRKSPNRWSARNAFTGRLLRRELDELQEPLECWLRTGTPSDQDLIVAFVGLCRQEQSPNASGEEVIVVGPGPIGALGEDFSPTRTVCRVVMPGVVSWPADDIVGGRADIGYLNGHSTQWLSTLEHFERDAIIKSFSSLRIKKATTWESSYPSVSQVRRPKDLFLTGEPNMVPIAIIDQLISGVSRVYVTGTSFFVGAEPYRTTDRRHFYEVGHGSDAFGAVYENSFERCYSHATHDQIVNRGLVRLMYDAGLVAGDDLFTSALLKSDLEYLTELEETYGRERR